MDRVPLSKHIILGVLITLIMLPGLGYRHVWQDEIETAERARTILESGLPKVVDANGEPSFNTSGMELEEGDLHRYTPWAQFYTGAAGLALARVTGLNPDGGLRVPFVVLHGASSALLSYGLQAYAGFPMALSLGLGAAFGLQTHRLLHNRSARYHSLLDFLAVLGLLALAAYRHGRKWAGPTLAAAIFVAPHVQTMGGSVLALTLGVMALWVVFDTTPAMGWRQKLRDLTLYAIVPGLVSLMFILILCRPWAHPFWGGMGNKVIPRGLGSGTGNLYAIVFMLGSGTLLLIRRPRRYALMLLTSLLVMALAVTYLDKHPFSQSRYYLFAAVLGLFWPLLMPTFSRPRALKWGIAILVFICLPEFVIGRFSTRRFGVPVSFAAGHGLRLLWDDAQKSRQEVQQPLHEAMVYIREHGQAGQSVLSDYVPHFVNWYLPEFKNALLPDPTGRTPLNDKNPLWLRPVREPDWEIRYTSYVPGFWNCMDHCDHYPGVVEQGQYDLLIKRLNKSVRMCVRRTWAAHQWNNAPFMNLTQDAFLAGGGPGQLVVAERCRPDELANKR